MGRRKTVHTYSIQVVDRAFALLDVLATSERNLRGTELSARLGLRKSTTHRLLMVLEQKGCVERSQATGKYHLGSKLFELGAKAFVTLDLRDTVRPYLERLVAETGETAHFGVLRQGEVISLFNVRSPRVLSMPSTVGGRIPAYCTSLGKAILAFSPDGKLKSLIEALQFRTYTRNTIVRPTLLVAELRRVRQQGYAIDNEEFEEGLKCIGAPIRNYFGDVFGAMGIAGPAFRLTKGRMPAVTQSVVNAAQELSSALGYRGELTGRKFRSSVNLNSAECRDVG